jgi:hypothetical protein
VSDEISVCVVLAQSIARTQGASVPGFGARKDEFHSRGIHGRFQGFDFALCDQKGRWMMEDKLIRQCEKCGGPIGPDFYVIKMSQAIVDYNAVSRLQGLSQYFGNYEIAKAFSPDKTLAVLVDGADANKWKEMVICQGCMVHSSILALLFEKGGSDANENENRMG